MIELMFLFALILSLIAGLWDLKTTDIPDEIPALITAVGIFGWFCYALTFGNFIPLAISLLVGTAFLAFGWMLYKAGQWGGGDAKLMAAIGYAVPFYPGVALFPIAFFANVFIVGAAYNIIYSIVLGLLNPWIYKNLLSGLAKNWKEVVFLPAAFAISVLAFMYAIDEFYPLFSIAAYLLALALAVFWVYAKEIEGTLFKKTVKASELREGDVLDDSKIWDGLTKEQAEKLNKTNKKYVIKTGICFGPVFFLAMLFTIFLGNALFILAGA